MHGCRVTCRPISAPFTLPTTQASPIPTNPVDIADYLIDQTGIDWTSIMTEWSWLLPASFSLWMVNRFGDSILVMEDGSVHMLDVGIGTLTRLASDRGAFCFRIDRDRHADDWLLMPLVDACTAAGLHPGHGQCYGFKLAPVFGGTYTVENTEVRDLAANLRRLARIHRQIRDLPDGTQVTVEHQ